MVGVAFLRSLLGIIEKVVITKSNLPNAEILAIEKFEVAIIAFMTIIVAQKYIFVNLSPPSPSMRAGILPRGGLGNFFRKQWVLNINFVAAAVKP